MRTRVGTVALAAAAVLVLDLSAASSAAVTASTWTVRPGGAITAMAGKTVLLDTTTDTSLTCGSSKMSGRLKSGSGLPGTGIGSFATAAYTCPTPIFSQHVTAHGLPWHLSAISYEPATGVTRGTISHVQLTFEIPETFCSAVIGGTGGPASAGRVAFSYSGKTGKLTILKAGSTLHWYQVHNCGQLLADGDAAALSASYAISPPQTITSQ